MLFRLSQFPSSDGGGEFKILPRNNSLADKLSFIGFWLQSKGISPVSAILIY